MARRTAAVRVSSMARRLGRGSGRHECAHPSLFIFITPPLPLALPPTRTLLLPLSPFLSSLISLTGPRA